MGFRVEGIREVRRYTSSGKHGYLHLNSVYLIKNIQLELI